MCQTENRKTGRDFYWQTKEDKNNLCEAEGSPGTGGLPWGAGWERDTLGMPRRMRRPQLLPGLRELTQGHALGQTLFHLKYSWTKWFCSFSVTRGRRRCQGGTPGFQPCPLHPGRGRSAPGTAETSPATALPRLPLLSWPENPVGFRELSDPPGSKQMCQPLQQIPLALHKF